MSNKFQTNFEKFIQNGHTKFIRTTDKKHVELVKKIWNKMIEKGDIYLGEYSGWYSISDETFLQNKDVIQKNDKCFSIETGKIKKKIYFIGKEVEWVKEINYKFKLSKYHNNILNWFSKLKFLLF
jgi:methionyl-tRNA synthetase